MTVAAEPMTPGSVARALARQRARIDGAVSAAQRAPGSVRLLAVSKFQPTSAIAEAYAAGQRDFGENYVQELTRKARELAHLEDLRFHLIGHLQTNKARVIAEVAHSVQTIDSVRLARELGKRRRAARPLDALDVLVEVNIAEEPNKSGCARQDLAAVLDAVEAEPGLRLRGLLAVPPQTSQPSESRPYFEAVAELRDQCGGSGRLPELSMGMSADLEVAIACGSTWVRIGTALFGARPALEVSP